MTEVLRCLLGPENGTSTRNCIQVALPATPPLILLLSRMAAQIDPLGPRVPTAAERSFNPSKGRVAMTFEINETTLTGEVRALVSLARDNGVPLTEISRSH
jgi:hypothetical protein